MKVPSPRCLSAAVAATLIVVSLGCGKQSPPSSGGPTTSSAERRFSIAGRVTLADADDSSGIQVYIPGTSAVAITGVAVWGSLAQPEISAPMQVSTRMCVAFIKSRGAIVWL